MIAYKFLTLDGTGMFTGFRWPLPAAGPGEWVDSEPDPCRSGIHACLTPDFPYWVGRALYEIELDGEVVEAHRKLVAPRGRLLRRIDGWDEAAHDAYTRMCAERAHALAAGASLDAAWEAPIEPNLPEGAGAMGFIAARIAEEIGGEQAYLDERARQARWLAERLGL